MSPVGAASSIPQPGFPQTPAHGAGSIRSNGMRGGEAAPTRRMSPELEAAFTRAYDAWERRQDQLTIFAQSPPTEPAMTDGNGGLHPLPHTRLETP